MIDHIGFAVSNVERSKTFYVDALKPLGIGMVMEVTAEQTGAEAHAGLAKITKRSSGSAGAESPKVGHTLRLQPQHAPMSILFYRAALAAGGRDNGPPGLRPHYHPNHYGAFVLDPDGNNIEAVCRRPA